MAAVNSRVARSAGVALVSMALLLGSLVLAGRASALKTVECQHPVMTGVEIYRLHHVSSHTACPVALALFSWENKGRHAVALYGCHGIGHPYLRLHSFEGWHLALTPDFVMSRHGESFAVGGTDFPVNCT